MTLRTTIIFTVLALIHTSYSNTQDDDTYGQDDDTYVAATIIALITNTTTQETLASRCEIHDYITRAGRAVHAQSAAMASNGYAIREFDSVFNLPEQQALQLKCIMHFPNQTTDLP